jgi:hypothetical protein
MRKLSFFFKQPDDDILPYSHLNHIFINFKSGEESSFNQDKLYCGCEDFPCSTISYGYERIDDEV